MLIVMLMIAHASSEWVEISQQHYRKPTYNNYKFQGIVSEEYFDETTIKPNRIYDNHTVTEYVWNKGSVHKVPKLGSVQRVQLDTNVVKAPASPDNVRKSDPNKNYHNIRVSSEVEDEDQIDFKNSFQISHEEKPFQKDQLVNNFGTHLKNEAIEHEFFTESGVQKAAHEVQQKYKGSQSTNNVPTRNKPSNIYSEVVTDKDREDVFNIKPFNDYIPTEAYSTSAVEIFTHPKRISDNEKKYSNPTSYVSDKKINALPINDDLSNQASVEFVSKQKYPKETLNEHFESNKDTNSQIPINPFKGHKEQIPDENSEGASIESLGIKKNTVDNLLQFMKVVADTIRKNTRRSVSSKTRYLQNLKDTILANIEERIDSAWPDDDELTSAPIRQRRAAAEARGHLEVPSSESALMTISFLTFAVFLIKLVLQVIQTYKNKAMMVTPTVFATVGRVAAATRRQRDLKP